MLKTNVRKYDIFKLYYWHNAILVVNIDCHSYRQHKLYLTM